MENSGKIIVVAFVAAVFLFVCGSVSEAGSFRRRFSISSREKLPWEEFERIDISGAGGDVNVTGAVCDAKKIKSGSVADSERYCSTIQLKRIRTCYSGSLSESRARVGEISSDINYKGGVYYMRGASPSGWPDGVAGTVDYIVSSPASAPLKIETVSGGVVVSGMRGAVEAVTVNGDIVVEMATSTLDLKTVTGDVSVKGSPSRAVVRSVTGGADFVISSLQNVNIDIDTVTGPVKIEVPEGFDALVRVSTAIGGVDAEKSGLPDQKREGSFFTAGSADAKNVITIKTFSGNVTITSPDSGNDRDGKKRKRAKAGDDHDG